MADGFRPVAAVVGMRPANVRLLGVNLPDEGYARNFPDVPAQPGIWIVTCDVELPVSYDDLAVEETFPHLGLEQLLWIPKTAEWRHANTRDLYILRGEIPPGEENDD